MNESEHKSTYIKYFTKNNDDCLEGSWSLLNNLIHVDLRKDEKSQNLLENITSHYSRGINPEKEFEICSKENPELFHKLYRSNNFSNK